MAAMRTARIVLPEKARKGEVVEIKTLITHPMETGFRRDHMGQAIPRDLITKLAVTYGGVEVFAMDMFTGTAANPFCAFSTVATGTAELVFTWTDQAGAAHVERRRLTVA